VFSTNGIIRAINSITCSTHDGKKMCIRNFVKITLFEEAM
jgi:hypothetical protein